MSVELQTLTRAREMVERGWVKGAAYANGHQRRCAGQAIQDAWQEVTGINLHGSGYACMCGTCPKPAEFASYNSTIFAFTAVIGDNNIPAWNDAAPRKREHVIAAFDKAIKRLQMREPAVTLIEVPVVKAEFCPIYNEDVCPETVFDTITVEAPKVGMIESGKKKVLELLGV